jgi:hypothetical protein
MRRSLCKAVAAIVLLGLAAQAQAKEYKGVVYNGQTGFAWVSDGNLEDNAFASNSNIGYRWGVVGFEVGHAWFGKFEESRGSTFGDVDVEARFKGWTAGLNFNADLNDRWAVQLRAGMFDWNVDGSVTGALTQDLDDDGSDWYVGGSATWQWRKRSSIGIGYTRYKAGESHIDMVGLASEYRFGAK